MTEDEAYKVHIQYTFNAFCKIVTKTSHTLNGLRTLKIQYFS